MKKFITIFAILYSLLSVAAPALAQTSEEVNITATVLENVQNIIQQITSVTTGQGGQFLVSFGISPMIINFGESKTNSLTVNIKFNVSQAYQMQISNNSDFSEAVWEPFSTTKIWQLERGDGQKTVWARFKNLSGWTSKTISTSIILDTTPPANVSNFEANGRDGEILLKWKNPSDADFVKVLIVRRRDFYPLTPNDGIAVYNGRGESFNDKGLNNGETYYYTAFSYDDVGNYSSGAVAASAAAKTSEITAPPGAIMAPTEEMTEKILNLTLPQFNFIQDGKSLKQDDGKITVNLWEPLKVSISYDLAPKVLKTIMMTLKQGDKTFSFLLRANADKTAYEATLMPPASGLYDFYISIFNYQNQTLQKIGGKLNVIKPQTVPVVTFYTIKKYAPPYLYILAGLIIIIIARISWLKYRSKIVNKSQNAKLQITNNKQ